MSLFKEFPSVSKEEWLDRVRTELKGREPESLSWSAIEGLDIAPFQHSSEAVDTGIHLGTQREDNSWEVGEYIPLSDEDDSNELTLKGLEGGVNAPLFVWPEAAGKLSFDVLLADIEPSFISLHFDWSQGGDNVNRLKELSSYLSAFEESKGSIHLGQTPQTMNAAELQAMQSFSKQHPDWQLLGIDGRAFYRGDKETIAELEQSLVLAADCLEHLSEKGFSPNQINQHLHVHFLMGTSYLLNIAKLRAWQILWANVLAHYEITEGPMPKLVGHCLPPAANDAHTNMIRAATQALSAAIGGVDRMYVAPAEGGVGNSSSRRTARNVQHLLQLESGINRVVDPAAGSYYLEGLSSKLAEQVWAKFIDRK